MSDPHGRHDIRATSLPEWWFWQPGGLVKAPDRHKADYLEVDQLVANRSDLVTRGTMTASQWLDDARRGWIRFHPEHERMIP